MYTKEKSGTNIMYNNNIYSESPVRGERLCFNEIFSETV